MKTTDHYGILEDSLRTGVPWFEAAGLSGNPAVNQLHEADAYPRPSESVPIEKNALPPNAYCLKRPPISHYQGKSVLMIKWLAQRMTLKRYVLSAGIIAMLLFIVGCTTPKTVMQSWVGEQESDLISRWGAPDSTVELKDGTKVCTWKRIWSDNYGVHQG